MGITANELREADPDAKKYLDDIRGFQNGRVNPPNEVVAAASFLSTKKEARGLSDSDIWAIAAAYQKSATIVLKRAGKKADKFLALARACGVATVGVDDFLSLEA